MFDVTKKIWACHSNDWASFKNRSKEWKSKAEIMSVLYRHGRLYKGWESIEGIRRNCFLKLGFIKFIQTDWVT